MNTTTQQLINTTTQHFINTYCDAVPVYMCFLIPFILFAVYKLYRAGLFSEFFKR